MGPIRKSLGESGGFGRKASGSRCPHRKRFGGDAQVSVASLANCHLIATAKVVFLGSVSLRLWRPEACASGDEVTARLEESL